MDTFDEDHVREVMARCQRGLARWQQYVREVEQGNDGHALAQAQAEHMRRQGIPAVRGFMHGGAVVVEVARPVGHG